MKLLRLSIALLVVLATLQSTAAFNDIASYPYKNSIETLRDTGLIQGYSTGDFLPYQAINRAEFLKILMLAVYGDEALSTENPFCFTDFTEPAQWYYVYACVAKERGIISGYPADGSFRGEQTVNFAEALKMALEAWNLMSLDRVTLSVVEAWFDPYFDAAASLGALQTLPLNPGDLLTRGEAAELIVALGQPIERVNVTQEVAPGINWNDNSTYVPATPDQVREYYDSLRRQPPTCGNGVIETGEACDDGNLLNDDGCSELCIIVPQPVRRGALLIEQRSLAGDTIAKGSKNVTLLSFDAVSGRQDVYLTGLQFTAGSGDLDAAGNYRLYADLDGNGSPEKLIASAVPQNNRLTFNSFTIPVYESLVTHVAVVADIKSTSNSSSFSLQFDTSSALYIQAVGVEDGEDVTGIVTDNSTCQESTCYITVSTRGSSLVSVGTQGSLYVTEDASGIRSRQLLAGALSEPLLRFELRAEGEAIEVIKIRIGGGTASIDHLKLYRAGESSPFAEARTSSCENVATGMFCADTSLIIPRDQDQDILVRAQVSPDTAGGKSGDTAALSLTANTSTNVAFEAWGDSSNTSLNQNNGNSTAEGEIFIGRNTPGSNSPIVGPTSDVVAAKITSITSSHIDPDETTVPSGLSDFATFRFTAAPHSNTHSGLNEVIIEDIKFTVSAINVEFAPGSIILMNTGNDNAIATCSSGTTGNFSVTCNNLESMPVNTVIDPGGILELTLRGNITNTQVSNGNSTLQAQLKNLGSRTNLGTINWNDSVFPFQWVDVSESTVRSTLYRVY